MTDKPIKTPNTTPQDESNIPQKSPKSGQQKFEENLEEILKGELVHTEDCGGDGRNPASVNVDESD